MAFRTHFPTARYVDPQTQVVQTVQLGLPVQPGNISYSDVSHKDHLKCMFCKAAMRVQGETISVAGSAAKGRDNFFTPVRRHEEDCSLSTAHARANLPERKKTDSKKAKRGYLFTINTMEHSDDLPVPSDGPFTISKGGRVLAVKDEFKGLKRVNVASPQQIVDIMARGEKELLVESWFAFRNLAQSYADTVLLSDRPATWQRFADRMPRMRTLLKSDERRAPFALMEFTTEKSVDFYHKHQFQPTVLGKQIFTTSDGVPHVIHPQVKIMADGGMDLKWAFREPGTFFVLGEVIGGTYQRRGADLINTFMTLRVTDPTQILSVNKENIRALAEAARDRRGDPSLRHEPPPA